MVTELNIYLTIGFAFFVFWLLARLFIYLYN